MQIIIDVIKQILSIILLAEKQKMRTFAMCFHSIRFKVNKGWSSAELLFLCPYARCFLSPLSKDSYQTSFYGVADCRTFGHLSYFSLPAEIADEEAHPSTGARALHGWKNTGRMAE